MREMTSAEFRAAHCKPVKKAWIKVSLKEERTLSGIPFRSKSERVRYQQLCAMRDAGQCRLIIREPKLDLAGVVYSPDFLWMDAHGALHFEEVEGRKSHPEKARRRARNVKQAKELLGVDVKLVKV